MIQLYLSEKLKYFRNLNYVNKYTSLSRRCKAFNFDQIKVALIKLEIHYS